MPRGGLCDVVQSINAALKNVQSATFELRIPMKTPNKLVPNAAYTGGSSGGDVYGNDGSTHDDRPGNNRSARTPPSQPVFTEGNDQEGETSSVIVNIPPGWCFGALAFLSCILTRTVLASASNSTASTCRSLFVPYWLTSYCSATQAICLEPS